MRVPIIGVMGCVGVSRSIVQISNVRMPLSGTKFRPYLNTFNSSLDVCSWIDLSRYMYVQVSSPPYPGLVTSVAVCSPGRFQTSPIKPGWLVLTCSL
ncbi:hypothetical protein XELAEV_18041936mg [Xenopus laevis]|uniref:Uncharacterized protein n=1 Tax=Xenopus laevis TaxID=8355 RepID=A0A974C3A7_XENLA|nr:hypothetical protein XELAEV_18041936mg [Xenopus laevis]